MSNVVRQLRAREDGFGIVELSIALAVLVVGLFALLAAFTSGYSAVNRASVVGTASVLADKEMESFRALAYGNVPTSGTTSSTVPGPDGRTYLVTDTFTTRDAPGTTPGTRSIIVVKVEVAEADGSPIWVAQESTFDELTGS